MSLEECFQDPEKERIDFINKNIVALLHGKDKKSNEQRVTKVINDYVGVDRPASSILAYAAEQGSLDKYLQKLEEYYGASLQYVHPEARNMERVAGAVNVHHFFLQCYQELGIKSQ